MGKRPTKEALIASYQMLYAKISSATAEVDGKKRIFRGQFKELFAEVPVSQGVITRFVWAISHSTKVLPTTLFSIKKDGNKGVIVERLHSGFYDDNRKHVVGTDLIPFIMQATTFWKPIPRAKSIIAVEQHVQEGVKQENSQKGLLYVYGKLDFSSHSDEELSKITDEILKELDKRDEERKAEEARKVKLNLILEDLDKRGISIEEALSLLSVI